MKYVDEQWHTTGFAWGNARFRRKDFWTKQIHERWTITQNKAIKRFISCYNCPQQCGALIDYPDVPRYMMKCYSKLSYRIAAFVDDQAFSWKICQRAVE